MIQVNKHPCGRVSNMIFGICSILDGVVRLCSLGFLHGTFTLRYSRYQAENHIRKLKSGKEK